MIPFIIVMAALAHASAPSDSIPNWPMAANPDYEVVRDTTVRTSGVASARIEGKRVGAPMPANLAQWFPADSFVGKRIRVRAKVRASSFSGNAQMWLRIEAPTLTRLDNMHDRPITADLAWTEIQSVQDVPPDAVSMTLGFLVNGAGRIWIDDVVVEVVDRSTPTTEHADLLPNGADWFTRRRTQAAARAPRLVNGSFELP